MSKPETEVSVVPAHKASWEDLQLVFGARGPASRCQCQRYKLAPKETFASVPDEDRALPAHPRGFPQARDQPLAGPRRGRLRVDRGARALEGYPITTTDVIAEELHVGTVPTFTAAGMTVVSRPTPRRVVMRIDF